MSDSPASTIAKRSKAKHTGRAYQRHMKTTKMTELPDAAEVQEEKHTDAFLSLPNEEKASLYLTILENMVEAVNGKVAPFGGARLCLTRTHAH